MQENLLSKEFRSRIISDRASGAVNIIQKCTEPNNFRGRERRREATICGDISELHKDFLPQRFGAISGFANNCDKLFKELISLIHSDQEIDKVRHR